MILYLDAQNGTFANEIVPTNSENRIAVSPSELVKNALTRKVATFLPFFTTTLYPALSPKIEISV